MPISYGGQKEMAIITDLDGTWADTRHLRHLAGGPDFDAFNDKAVDAQPILWVDDAIHQWYAMGAKVIIITARSEKYRTSTTIWANRYHSHISEIHMRPVGDLREDAEVKYEILHRYILPKYDIYRAYEDHPEVVKMMEKEGLPVTMVGGWEKI